MSNSIVRQVFLAIIVIFLISVSVHAGSREVGESKTKDKTQEILITDMSTMSPKSAIVRKIEQGKWRLMDYKAEGISGTMIDATSSTNAPVITLPLNTKGWHKIFVGFWNTPYGGEEYTSIRLKLTDDPAFFAIQDHQPYCWDRTDLKQAFWKCADLTEQDIIVAQQSKGRPRKSNLCYIKLIPMDKQEVEQLQKQRNCPDTRKVIAVIDGASYLELKGCTTKEEIKENFERFRWSDIGKVFYAVNYGTTTNYPSNIGVLCAGDGKGFVNKGQKILYNSLNSLLNKNIIPFVAAMEHVHEMGCEFHIQFRMGLGDGSILGEGVDGFAHKHPELRIVHKDGTPLPKISYAFPEARNFILQLIDEVTEYDIDGINLGFNRGPLFVGYEKPVVDSFIKKYGIDPRTLADDDPKVIKHKADFITQLVREIRDSLIKIGKKRGRKIELSAWPTGGWNRANNLFHGQDVETWLKEGLIDSTVSISDEVLLRLARESECKIYWGMGSRTPENYVKKGLGGYSQNVDGFVVWDIDLIMEFPEHWEILRNLGHQERLKEFAEKLPGTLKMKMLSVGGHDFSRTYGKGAPDDWPPEMMIFSTDG